MNRQDLLLKPIWSIKNICDYTGFGRTKSYEIMNKAKRRYKGVVDVSDSVVSRDSVLLVLKTSIERETYIKDRLQERRENEETLHG